MEDVGADTAPIKAVLQAAGDDGLEAPLKHAAIPEPSRRFMASTQAVIKSRKPHVLATAFCFGRERLVPELFRDILDQLVNGKRHAPILIWYLERHISLDADSHGPLAEQMVMELCQSQASAINDVASMRARVEQDRAAFWAAIAEVLTVELLAPSGQPQR